MMLPYPFLPYPDEPICIYCGEEITKDLKRCPNCNRLINNWVECGKDLCGNCHESLRKGDKYCRLCGTPVGHGAYNPYQVSWDMQCVYGPMPVPRLHECKRCGSSWTVCAMIDREYYCPECGGAVSIDGVESHVTRLDDCIT